MHGGQETRLFREEALDKHHQGPLPPDSGPIALPRWTRVLFGVLVAALIVLPAVLRYTQVRVPVQARVSLQVKQSGGVEAVVEVPGRFTGVLARGDAVPVRWAAGSSQEIWIVSDTEPGFAILRPAYDQLLSGATRNLTGTATIATTRRRLLAVLAPPLAERLGVDEDGQ